MRVLIAARTGGANGIETYTRYLARALTEEGHLVVLADASDEAVTSADAGVHAVVRLPPRRWWLRCRVGPLETAVTAWASIRRAVAQYEVDVVHATYPEFAVLSSAAVVSTVWHTTPQVVRRVRTAPERNCPRRDELMYSLSDRIAFAQSDALVAVSRPAEGAARDLHEFVQWVPPFIAVDTCQLLSSRPRANACVFVARWLDLPRKRLEAAMKAVALARRSLPDLRLVLVGEWQRGQPNLEPWCEWLGPRDARGVSDIFRTSACAVLSSSYEEFGYVALEALAVGTPVAASPLPGFVGLDAPGLVTAAGNTAEDLADAVVRAVGRDASLPSACRADSAVATLESVYDACLARKRERPPLARTRRQRGGTTHSRTAASADSS